MLDFLNVQNIAKLIYQLLYRHFDILIAIEFAYIPPVYHW